MSRATKIKIKHEYVWLGVNAKHLEGKHLDGVRPPREPVYISYKVREENISRTWGPYFKKQPYWKYLLNKLRRNK